MIPNRPRAVAAGGPSGRGLRRLLLRTLLGAGLLLFLSGCVTRERSNPLDPYNSHTGGAIPGFNAIAGDSVVELRWVPLTQTGVRGYRIQRWTPGGPSRLLGAADYGPSAVAAEDHDVSNESTYVYRLIAHLADGDSAVSPPDSATPGPRRILALAADQISLAGLTPDLRDFLFTVDTGGDYQDMELDRRSASLWVLSDDVTGAVLSRFSLNGTALDQGVVLQSATDLSVGGTRSVAWVALPDDRAVAGYLASSPSPAEIHRIFLSGSPRVVAAGTLDPAVWVGTQEGEVFRADPTATAGREILGEWTMGAPIGPIALDEPDRAAWVVVKRDVEFHDLYKISGADSSVVLVASNLDNVVDLATDPSDGDLWVSERGVPRAGAGAVRLLTRTGTQVMRVGSLEPYGLDVDPEDGSCWVADLKSNRILRLSGSGMLLQASRTISIPFEVRVALP